MKKQLVFGCILFACSCSFINKKNELEQPVTPDAIMLNDLFNEVLELDSILLNGRLNVITTLDSAKREFGEILETYYDHRYPYSTYEGSNLDPRKTYVFESAIFRQWNTNEVILLKLDLGENNFLTIGRDTIRKGESNYFLNNYPISYKIAFMRETESIGNAPFGIIELRSSNNDYDHKYMKWKFIMWGGGLHYVEYYNIN